VSATQLFSVTSKIDNWPHRGARFDGVEVDWLVEDRDYDPGFDYAELLDHNRDQGYYPEDLVNESFTREEADRFAEYLKTCHGPDVHITPHTMPIRCLSEEGYSFMAISGAVMGSDAGFYPLWKHDGYDLPFKVQGYYRIWEDTPRTPDLMAEAEEFDRSAQKIIDTMVRYNVATLGELPAAIRKTHESGDR